MSDIITQDALFFFDGRPVEFSLYARLAERLLEVWPGTEIRVRKTQIGFYDPRLFACVSLTPVRRKAERPPRFITVTFGLTEPLEDLRALAVPVRPNRWTHHVIVGEACEIDDNLIGWIARSHDIPTKHR